MHLTTVKIYILTVVRVRHSESKAMWEEAIVRSGEVRSLRDGTRGLSHPVRLAEILATLPLFQFGDPPRPPPNN